MSFEFNSVEEALESMKANLVEVEVEAKEEGQAPVKKFVFTPMAELHQKFVEKENNYGLSIKDKEKLETRARKAETELKGAKDDLAKAQSLVEQLQKPGEDATKLQAAVKERDEAWQTVRTLQAKMETIPQLEERNSLLEQQLNNLNNEVKNRKISDALRKEAIAAKVPQMVIDSPDFLLLVSQFEMTDHGEILTRGENPKSVRAFIADRQKTTPYWNAPTISSGAGAGTKSGVTTDQRDANFQKAKAEKNVLEMARNAPVIDKTKPQG